MRPEYDPTKHVDVWPMPGLSTTDRRKKETSGPKPDMLKIEGDWK